MIKLFSGTNSHALAKKISDLSSISLAKAEITRFKNSEVRVRILEKVNDQTCAVIQAISQPTDENLMEFLFFCDALKRSEAKKVIAIVPYFGYARQNIQHRDGEDVSTHVVIKLLETVGFDEVWTIDIHDEGTQGIFSVPLKHFSVLSILANEVKTFLGNRDNVVIASPDQGGVERGRTFAEAFFGNTQQELVVIEKKRDLEHIHESKAIRIYGDVKDKTVILVDDIATSGRTLLNAAELCFSHGAKRLLAAVVHHDFSPDAPQKIQDSRIEKFFTTDTIPLRSDQSFPELQELTVAPLLAEELKKL